MGTRQHATQTRAETYKPGSTQVFHRGKAHRESIGGRNRRTTARKWEREGFDELRIDRVVYRMAFARPNRDRPTVNRNGYRREPSPKKSIRSEPYFSTVELIRPVRDREETRATTKLKKRTLDRVRYSKDPHMNQFGACLAPIARHVSSQRAACAKRKRAHVYSATSRSS